jgi:ABC-2 type transport system permease protein
VGTPDEYFAYVAVGLILFGLVTATLATPVATLRAELQAATFERLAVSPFGPVASTASLLLFPVTVAGAVGLLALAFAALAFGVDLRWSTAALAPPLALLAALAFAPFGVAMAAAVVLFKQTNAGATFAIAAMTLVAGVYFPVELLPAGLRWAANSQPFTPAVELLRHVLVGTPLREGPGWELLRLAGFALCGGPVALGVLRAAVEASLRRGTLTEY